MIHFISYGDEKYSNSKSRIQEEAKSFGFDVVDVFGPEDLDPKFVEQTSPFINYPRGGGYWLWKPYFLKKKFDEIKYGDFLVYADSGCTINPNGKERFEYYLSTLKQNGSGLLRFSFPGTKERLFTNSKVFEVLGVDSEDFKNTDHLMATIQIFQKNKISQDYINKFYELAVNNTEIFTDEFNNYNKDSQFMDHRHDQSVSSCLAKIVSNNLTLIVDETYAPDQNGWVDLFYNKKVPFLSTRIKN